jgi:hypothetical protein
MNAWVWGDSGIAEWGKPRFLCQFVHHESHTGRAWDRIRAPPVTDQWQPSPIYNNVILHTF